MSSMSTAHQRSAVVAAIFVALALSLLPSLAAFASDERAMAVGPVVTLDPVTQPKFTNPLPIPARIDATSGGYFDVAMRQTTQHLGLFDPITGLPLMTTVWGYQTGTLPTLYPGPTFVARTNVPVDIQWKNELVDQYGNNLPHILPIDQTVHWALHHGYPEAGVPLVTHIHGGHTESASDGIPEAWFTPGFIMTGDAWVKATYHYDNSQEAGTIWYHDHALGITRLNVYAGLAGFYLIRDDNEDALVAVNNLPTGPYEIEIAIQDRMFYPDGELYYPSAPPTPTAPDPSVLPEFFGNVILVNGAAWPVLDVEPRQYRFRFLNGSDSRFYNMWLPTPSGINVPFWQVGTDDGLLNAPVMRNTLLLAPGERADVVIDFSDPAYAGLTLIVKNNAKGPYPKGAAVDPRTTGQIMAFRVVKPLDTSHPMTTLPANLRPVHGAIMPLVQSGPTRSLGLYEMMDQYGRMMPMLGTTAAGAMMWDDPTTEMPVVNDTEVWTIYNTTPDAHPIHLHLVAFQILDRQKFKATMNAMTGALTSIKLIGQPTLPPPEEMGWKDTVIMQPGEVTRIIAKFDRVGEYVWHCHIISHEDNEMMRRYEVVPAAGPLAAGNAQEAGPNDAGQGSQLSLGRPTAGGITVLESAPNPFSGATQITFALPRATELDLKVYNAQGREVKTLAGGSYPAGTHSVQWDGRDGHGDAVAAGLYFYQLKTDDTVIVKKAVVVRR
jgi:spore coat protein A